MLLPKTRKAMRWTQESLVKTRGIVMLVVGVIVVIVYLVGRL